MNNISLQSMDHAFAKLKKSGSVTLESKNYDQISVWEKAFRKKLGPYSFFEILVSVEWARGQYHLTAKLEKIQPNMKAVRHSYKTVFEVSEEQALKNYHALCNNDQVAKQLVKELYEAGMIPGIRSIVLVKRITHNSKNGLSESLSKKNENHFGT